MKVYITFGQIHTHSINGKILDKNCVAAIECSNFEEGHNKAIEWFDGEFHNSYAEHPSDETMSYYPRGVIEL